MVQGRLREGAGADRREEGAGEAGKGVCPRARAVEHDYGGVCSAIGERPRGSQSPYTIKPSLSEEAEDD